MSYLRYGKVKTRDHVPLLGIIVFLLMVSTVAFIRQRYSWGCVYLIAAILTMFNILFPYFERFSISGNVITARKFFYSSKKVIPSKSAIIVTQADVHEVIGQQSALIKDRYAVSILRYMPLDTILESLHGKFSSQSVYTNSTIERSFAEYKFIYSFVLHEDLLEQVLQRTSGIIVIPGSISHRVVVNSPSAQVYIDSGY